MITNTTALDNLFAVLFTDDDRGVEMIRTMIGAALIEDARDELSFLKAATTRCSLPEQNPAMPVAERSEIAQAIRGAMGFDVDGEALRAMVQEVIKEEVRALGDLNRAAERALADEAEKAVADVDLEDLARDAVLHAMRDVDMDAIAKDVCEEAAGSAVAEHVEDAVSQAAESAVNDADLDAAIAEHLDNNLDADMVKEAVESALVRRKMVLTFGE